MSGHSSIRADDAVEMAESHGMGKQDPSAQTARDTQQSLELVYVTNSVVPGRAANSIQVMHNCEAFATRGHDVTLLVPERELELSGVDDIFSFYDVKPCFEIEKIPRPNLSSLGTLLVNYRIGREAARRGPDIVYGRSTIACYFASLHGASTMLESHEPMTNARFGRVNETFFSRLSQHSTFEQLVVISESLEEYYQREYPHIADSIVVAHNCAKQVEAVQPISLDTDDSRLQVGYIGNLYDGRGMDLLATVAGRIPSVDFHIVGGDQSDIDLWKDQLSGVGNITFHGFVPQQDLDSYRQAFDVLLAPYQWDLETRAGHNTVEWMSPLKIVEYMASGRAIVASDLPALRETLTDERTALLCDPEDADEWTEAIDRLAENPAFRTRLGQRAQAEYEQHYTMKARADTILDDV